MLHHNKNDHLRYTLLNNRDSLEKIACANEWYGLKDHIF